MSEKGKLKTLGLDQIPAKYFEASGKKKFSLIALVLLIIPFVMFYFWAKYSTMMPTIKTTPTNTLDVQSQVQKLVNEEYLKITELAVKSEVGLKHVGTNTPTPFITSTNILATLPFITPADALESGLDPDQVMQVLRNLPSAGKIRLDKFNERVIGTRDVKVSFYFPPYGGINCADRYQCSFTASGKYVLQGVGYYVACPSSLAFGTKIIIFNKEWICEDRGGAITEEWIDLLYPYQPYGLYWGQLVNIKIIGDTPEITNTPTNQEIESYPTVTMTPMPIYPTVTMTPIPTITPTPTNTPTALMISSNTLIP